jgi:hypothetical protein
MILARANRSTEDVIIVPVVITELKFSDVQREIFGGHFVEGSDHAALHQRPETFDGLCVNRAHDVLAASVIDGAVKEMVAGEVAVCGVFVGADHGDLGRHGFVDEALKRRVRSVLNDAGHDVTLTLYSAHNDLLFSSAIAGPVALGAVLVLPFAADEGLIDLHDPHELVETLIRQPGAHPVAHVMGGTIRAEAHDALDLESGDAFLARHHHVNDAEPLAEGLIGILEDGSGDVRETIALIGRASVALPLEAHGRNGEYLDRSAARAMNTIGPTMRDKIDRASVFVRKHLLKLGDCHLMNAHHVSPSMRAL